MQINSRPPQKLQRNFFPPLPSLCPADTETRVTKAVKAHTGLQRWELEKDTGLQRWELEKEFKRHRVSEKRKQPKHIGCCKIFARSVML